MTEFYPLYDFFIIKFAIFSVSGLKEVIGWHRAAGSKLPEIVCIFVDYLIDIMWAASPANCVMVTLSIRIGETTAFLLIAFISQVTHFGDVWMCNPNM